MRKREIEFERVELVSGASLDSNGETNNDTWYARVDVILDEDFKISRFLEFDEKRLLKRQMGINFDIAFTKELDVARLVLIFDKTKFNNYIGLECRLKNIPYTVKFKVSDAEIAELQSFYKQGRFEFDGDDEV